MNKLFLSILIICSFLIGNAYAKKYKVGDIVEKQFYINKKHLFILNASSLPQRGPSHEI